MKLTSKRIIVFLAVIVLGISAAIGGKIWAQGKAQTAISAPAGESAWVKRCDDLKDGEKTIGQYCEAVQSLSVVQKDADPSTAQRIAEMALGYPEKGKDKAQAAIILPLGVLVEKKVELSVDGSDLVSFNIRYCDNGGCIGMFELDNAQLEKMRKGKEVVIKSEAATGQPLIINLSLSGFGAVVDEVKPKG